MESSRFLFNPPACGGNMLYLGGAGGGDPFLQGGRTMMSMSMQESPKGRPFFRSPDDLYDDEYYDDLCPEKKRRLSHDQVQMLEKSFEDENKLEPDKKSLLAKKLGLQPRQVAVWFQNRRARWKTKQLERDYDVLKASYDLLLSNYDSIANENTVLKSEVASLTEKCLAKVDRGEAPVVPCITTSEPLLADITYDFAPHSGTKPAEDRRSSGSDSSAVIDDNCLQLIDSGDSYFHEYPHCAGLQMEHDDDDDRNGNSNNFLFSDMFASAAATNQQNQEGGGPPAWWAWP